MWDFDNTLAYRDGMWSQTIYDLLQEQGYDNIKLEDINPFLRSGFPWHTPEQPHKDFFGDRDWWNYMTSHFSAIIQKLGVNEEQSDKIAGRIREHYLDIKKWHLYDDTIPCLKKTIDSGYENLILSNHVPELPELVSGLVINKYFSRVCSSAHLGYEKPNIQAYKEILRNIEDTDNVTMIGDSYTVDVQGAIHAGVKAILVRKENTFNYQYYCKSLDEVFNILS